MAINHLDYQGRLVDVPNFGQTNSGKDYANFRLAWSEKYKDGENNCFLECKAFGPTAKFMSQYMNTKGQEIIVEGKLNTDQWTGQDGNKRSKIVLMVNSVHFCGKRDNTAPAEPAPGSEEDKLPF